MTQQERMERGLIYDPADKALMQKQTDCLGRLFEYNATKPYEAEKRGVLLKKMFAEIGEGCYFEPPLRANWGCTHVHAGDHVYSNYNLVLVDDEEIFLGNNVMIAPNVTITTATHPICPELRERGLQYNRSVRIGNNVWIGAGVIILPGVTVGDNSVIGAGSVVTRDIPANVVAYGVPCKVRREIGARDREVYDHTLPIDWENLKEL